jgi:hypothetical protein
MSLLWLFLIPPYLFVCAALVRLVLVFCIDRMDSWWSLPLYISIAIPMLLGGLFGFGWIVALVVGGV